MQKSIQSSSTWFKKNRTLKFVPSTYHWQRAQQKCLYTDAQLQPIYCSKVSKVLRAVYLLPVSVSINYNCLVVYCTSRTYLTIYGIPTEKAIQNSYRGAHLQCFGWNVDANFIYILILNGQRGARKIFRWILGKFCSNIAAFVAPPINKFLYFVHRCKGSFILWKILH